MYRRNGSLNTAQSISTEGRLFNMPSFQSMFMKSKGKPIQYAGTTLVMHDEFPTEGAIKLQVIFETCNGNPVKEDSTRNWIPRPEFFRTAEDGLAPWRNLEPPGRWRQGIRLKCDGSFWGNNQTAAGKRGIVLWADSAPEVVELQLLDKPTAIIVYNVWDGGNGVIDAWHNGAAIIVEELPNGRRYRCNDGFADEDFDDLVFRIERVSDTAARD